MNPGDRDDRDDVEEPGQELEHSDEETRRSIFSTLWLRVVLVVIVFGVIAAVTVPYILEWMNPSTAKTAAVTQAPRATTPPAAPPAAAQPAAAQPATPLPMKPAITPERTPAPTGAKPEKPKDEKPTGAAKPAPRPAQAAASKAGAAKAGTTAPSAEGGYFVQVGAFKDRDRATRLAARLREQNLSVHESTASAGAGGGRAPAVGAAASDRYDVFVSGGAAADLSAKLTAKGLATSRAGDGVVVKPSLPLRDAVALSKDLAVEGLKVQVKRAGAGAPAPAGSAAPAPAAAGETLHRVRVGPFPDLAAAKAALGELEAKGYKGGFLARGGG